MANPKVPASYAVAAGMQFWRIDGLDRTAIYSKLLSHGFQNHQWELSSSTGCSFLLYNPAGWGRSVDVELRFPPWVTLGGRALITAGSFAGDAAYFAQAHGAFKYLASDIGYWCTDYTTLADNPGVWSVRTTPASGMADFLQESDTQGMLHDSGAGITKVIAIGLDYRVDDLRNLDGRSLPITMSVNGQQVAEASMGFFNTPIYVFRVPEALVPLDRTARVDIYAGTLLETVPLFEAKGPGIPMRLDLHYDSGASAYYRDAAREVWKDRLVWAPFGQGWGFSFGFRVLGLADEAERLDNGQRTTPDGLLVQDQWGRVSVFHRDSPNTFVPVTNGWWGAVFESNDNAVTLEDTGSGYVLKAGDYSDVYSFDKDGYLAEIRPRRYGRALTFTRTGASWVTTDSSGRTAHFNANADGRIAEVIDPAGARWSFTYDGPSLVAIDSPQGRVAAFEYDDPNFVMRKKTDARGTMYAYEYRFGSPSGQRLFGGSFAACSHTDADRGLIRHAFSYQNDAARPDNKCHVEYTNPAGGVTTYELQIDDQDHGGQLGGNSFKVTPPDGGTTLYDYINLSGSMSMVARPRGGTIVYDALWASLNKITFSDGTTEEYGYESGNPRRVAWHKDRQGLLERYEHVDLPDAFDLLSKITRPAPFAGQQGLEITYKYASPGDLIEETEGTTEVVKFEYTLPAPALGMHSKVIHCESSTVTGADVFTYDPFGRVQRCESDEDTRDYVYDASGRLTQETITSTAGTAHSRRLTRNAMGDVLAVTDFDGATVTYTYDSEGLLLVETHTDPAGVVTSTRFVRDVNGNVRQSIEADGAKTTFTYSSGNRLKKIEYDGLCTVEHEFDDDGNLTRETTSDAAGNVVVRDRTYDAFGGLLQVTHPAVPLPDGSGGTWRPTTTLDRFPSGKIRKVTQDVAPGNSLATEYVLDGAGRPYKVKRTIGNDTFDSISLLDDLGRLEALQGPQCSTIPTTRDKNDDIIAGEARAHRFQRLAEFDCRNRLTSISDSNAREIATFEYDDADRPTTTSVLDPSQDTAAQFIVASARAYDGDGQVQSTTTASGVTTTFTYDTIGRVATADCAGAAADAYEYDGIGRVTKLTRTAPGMPTLVTRYTYGPLDLPATIDHENTKGAGPAEVQHYQLQYDANRQLISKTDPLGRAVTMRYDLGGNLTRLEINGRAVNFTYDAMNRVASVQHGSGTEHRTMAYDAYGNMTFAENAAARMTWRYDAAGRVVQRSVTYKAANVTKSLHYQYDAFGMLAARRDDDGNKLRFGYDEEERLVTVFNGDDASPTVRWEYSASGGVARRMLDGPGVTSRYLYTRAGEIRELHHETPLGAVAGLVYTRDGMGRVIGVSRTGRELNASYAYNTLGRLDDQLVTGPGGVELLHESYAYDAIGNRIAVAKPEGTEQVAFDVANQLQQRSTVQLVPVPNSDLSAAADSEDGPQFTAAKAIDGDTASTSAWQSNDSDVDHQLTISLGQPTPVVKVQPFFPPAFGPAVGLKLQVQNSGGSWEPARIVGAVGARYTSDSFDAAGPSVSLFLNAAAPVSGIRITRPATQGFTSAPTPSDRNRLSLSEVVLHSATGGAESAAYDDGGARIRRGLWQYMRDDESRMVRVTDGIDDVTFTYGPDGRVLSRENARTGAKTLFLWDGVRLYGEYDDSGSMTRTYLAAPQMPVPLGFRAGADTYYYLEDERDSVIHVVNASGAVMNSYAYDAWGAPLLTEEQIPQPLRFMSRPLDADTGIYHWHLRNYDPATATFLEKDPAPGAANPYTFLRNDPANARDPLGASWWDTFVETMKELPGALYEDFGSGAAASRLKTFTVAVGEGAKNAVTTTAHAIAHPVEAVEGIAHAVKNYDQVIKKIGESWDRALWDARNNPDHFAETIGRLTGELMAGEIMTAGAGALASRAARLAESAGLGERLAQVRNAFSRVSRCNRGPKFIDTSAFIGPHVREVVALVRPKSWRKIVYDAFGKYLPEGMARRHIVGDELIRSMIEKVVNGAEDQWEFLSKVGYHPSRFKNSVQRACEEWHRFTYNKIENLWVGDSRMNSWLGSKIPSSDGNILGPFRVDMKP